MATDGSTESTLGHRLDRVARGMLARRAQAARRVRQREHPTRRWDPPAQRRLRVEADVPPVWAPEPLRHGFPDVDPGPPAPPPGLPFPAELRERLRPVVGPGLDRLVLHDGDVDPAADAVAEQHAAAAAVTVGEQIFLRRGRFRPQTPAGRGLLAHEAWHAVQPTRPGTAWRRATVGGQAREEQVAHTVGAMVETDPAPPDGAPVTAAVPVPARSAEAPPVVAAARISAGVAGPAVAGGGFTGRGDDVPPFASRPGDVHLGVPTGATRRSGGHPAVAAPHRAPPTPAAAVVAAASAPPSPALAPMAAPLAGAADPAPAPSAPASAGASREDMLRAVMRQVRIDRERGA